MDRNSSAAMLAAKRSAGVAVEVNMSQQAMKHASEGIHPGFKTHGRHHQKGVSVTPQKILKSLKKFK